MAATKKTSRKDLINSILFIAIILAVGITTLLTPKENFSAYEKRALAPFPNFSKENFFSGEFFKGIQTNYADHFIFRISITAFDKNIKALFGIKDDGVTLYADAPKTDTNTAVTVNKQTKTEVAAIDAESNNPSTDEAPAPSETSDQSNGDDQDNFQIA